MKLTSQEVDSVLVIPCSTHRILILQPFTSIISIPLQLTSIMIIIVLIDEAAAFNHHHLLLIDLFLVLIVSLLSVAHTDSLLSVSLLVVVALGRGDDTRQICHCLEHSL